MLMSQNICGVAVAHHFNFRRDNAEWISHASITVAFACELKIDPFPIDESIDIDRMQVIDHQRESSSDRFLKISPPAGFSSRPEFQRNTAQTRPVYKKTRRPGVARAGSDF